MVAFTSKECDFGNFGSSGRQSSNPEDPKGNEHLVVSYSYLEETSIVQC
jgi:hypothetical protein